MFISVSAISFSNTHTQKNKKAASFERTSAPSISYDVPNPAPALRKRVTPKPIGDVHPRDFERVESQMVQSIHDIFFKIQAEYKQVRCVGDQSVYHTVL